MSTEGWGGTWDPRQVNFFKFDLSHAAGGAVDTMNIFVENEML